MTLIKNIVYIALQKVIKPPYAIDDTGYDDDNPYLEIVSAPIVPHEESTSVVYIAFHESHCMVGLVDSMLASISQINGSDPEWKNFEYANPDFPNNLIKHINKIAKIYKVIREAMVDGIDGIDNGSSEIA